MPSLDMIDVLVLVVFLTYMLKEHFLSWWLHYQKQHKAALSGRVLKVGDVPGPKALPVLGTSWLFSIFGRYKLPEMHLAYQDLFKRYGSIVREEALWNFPVISLKDRGDIKRVMEFKSHAPLRPPTQVIAHYRTTRPDRYSSLGMVNEQGKRWNDLRSKLTCNLTKSKTFMDFAPALDSVCEDFLSLIRANRDADAKVTDFVSLAQRLGLESTCTVVLGRRLGFLEGEMSSQALRLARVVEGHFRACRDTQYGLPFWKFFPTRAYKELQHAEEDYYEIISELVDKALQEEQDTSQVDSVRSVFMHILNTPDLDLRDKKSGIIDFIASGIQTMGNSLVFLLQLVGKYPHVQQRLYDELIAKGLTDGVLTANDLNGAEYHRAVIMECYRIRPTAMCIARILEEEMILSGYHLSPGTVVLCHNWSACMDDANFEDARSFRPERWMEEGKQLRCSPELVKPYGFGRRICPGMRLVEHMLRLALAKIVRDFHVEFQGDLGMKFEFLLVPSGPIEFTLRDRH